MYERLMREPISETPIHVEKMVATIALSETGQMSPKPIVVEVVSVK